MLRWSRMYQTNGITRAQTTVGTTMSGPSTRSRVCSDLTAPPRVETPDVVVADVEAPALAEIPAHLPSLPSWHDVASVDFKRSVYASRALPHLDAQVLRELVGDTRPMMDLLENDVFEPDTATRYYVALRAIAEYEATLFPRLQNDFEWLQGVASRQRGGKSKFVSETEYASEGAYRAADAPSLASTSGGKPKRKRGVRIWRCWTDMFSDIFSSRNGNVDLVGDFYRTLPGRYEAGLRNGLAALSLGHDLTLSLITNSRIAHYPGGGGGSEEAQKAIRRRAKRALTATRLLHGQRSFYAERDFYQLMYFGDSVPADGGPLVRLRQASISDDRYRLEGHVDGTDHDDDLNEDLSDNLNEDLSDNLNEDLSDNLNDDLDKDINEDLNEDLDDDSGDDSDDERPWYALDVRTIKQLENSLEVQKGWPVMDAGLVEGILVKARKAIGDRLPGSPEAAFATFSEVREEIHEVVLKAFDDKMIDKVTAESGVIEGHLEQLRRRAERADAARGKRVLDTLSGGKDARPAMAHHMHDFIYSLPLHYRDGLREMYLTLSFGSDSDLIDAACDILMPLAAQLAAKYDYRPENYIEMGDLYDPMNDADATDRLQARAQKRQALLWTLCAAFDGMTAAAAPSRPQYRHVVADAEKTARHASDQYAKAMTRYKQRAAMASMHALIPAAAALIREGTKIKPRYTSDTIFEHVYWKNATDIRAHHTQTAEYQHRHTGAYLSRRRLDERIRVAGGWSPSERLEGFNRLPPRVRARHVRFITGQSDIDVLTHFRNGQSINWNISSNPVVPTEPRFRQGPDGRYPTVNLRRHSDLSHPQIVLPEPPPSRASPLRQRRNGQYLTLTLRIPEPE